MYRAKEGALDDFVREWRDRVLPLRLAFGFEVLGPWVTGDGQFVWLVGHRDGIEAADAAYYDSPERRAVDPDPARHLASAQQWLLEER